MSTGSLTPPASHSLRSRISLASLGQFSRFARGILYFALTGSLPYPFFSAHRLIFSSCRGPLLRATGLSPLRIQIQIQIQIRIKIELKFTFAFKNFKSPRNYFNNSNFWGRFGKPFKKPRSTYHFMNRVKITFTKLFKNIYNKLKQTGLKHRTTEPKELIILRPL